MFDRFRGPYGRFAVAIIRLPIGGHRNRDFAHIARAIAYVYRLPVTVRLFLAGDKHIGACVSVKFRNLLEECPELIEIVDFLDDNLKVFACDILVLSSSIAKKFCQ